MGHRRHRHSSARRNKQKVNKTLEQAVSIAKTTSNKYMPKFKSGLETVGSKVVKTGEQTIPFLQHITRKFFGMFTKKSQTRKNRKH